MLKGFPHRKDNIILVAIDIISEDGLEGLSTKKIAQRQGISESILYKYFSSLDEVLICVVNYFSRFDDMIINTIKKKEIPYCQKIFEFLKSYVELYENYPNLPSVLLNYDALLKNTHTKDLVLGIMYKRCGFLSELITGAQKQHEINDLFSPQDLCDIIFGYLNSIILKWKINSFGFSLKNEFLTVLEKLLKSLSLKDELFLGENLL